MSGCVRATDTVVSAYRNSYMQVAGEPTRYVLMVHGDGFRHSRGDESGRIGERMLYHRTGSPPDRYRCRCRCRYERHPARTQDAEARPLSDPVRAAV